MDELEDYSEYKGIIHNKSIANNNNFQSNYSEYNGLLPSSFKFFEDNLSELIPYDFKFNDDLDLDPIGLNHLFRDKFSSNLPWDKLDGFCYLSREEDSHDEKTQEDEVLDNRLNVKDDNNYFVNDYNKEVQNNTTSEKKQEEKNILNTNILKKICDLEGIVFEKVKNPNNTLANQNIIKSNIVHYIKMVENHLIGSILSYMISLQKPVKVDDLVFHLQDKIENMRKSNGCKYSENIHKVIYSTLISNKIFKKNRYDSINSNQENVNLNHFNNCILSKSNNNQTHNVNSASNEYFYFNENEATDYILNTIEKEIENSQKVKRNLKSKKLVNNNNNNNSNINNTTNLQSLKIESTGENNLSKLKGLKELSSKNFRDENNFNLLSLLPFSNNSYKSSVSSKKKDSNYEDYDIQMSNNKSKNLNSKVNTNHSNNSNFLLKEENSINSTIITDNFTNSSNYSSINKNQIPSGSLMNYTSNLKNSKISSTNNLNSIKKKVNKVYEILDDLLTKLVNKNELESCIISNLKKSKDEFEIVKQLGDDNCCMGIIVCLKFFKKTSKFLVYYFSCKIE